MNTSSSRFARAIPAAALACLAGSASAQQYTLYGLVDAAVERIDHVGANAGSLTRMPSTTGSFPSRWGLRGSEDLGDGLKAVFTLEAGFGPDTGVSGQGGRMFGRQAFVGLSGGWGTVSAGRHYTMLFWSLLEADVIGPMVFAIGSLDSYVPNTRVDNALSYRGKFGDLSAGATFSFGRDSANPAPNNPAGTNCGGELATDSKACREWSVLLKYDQPSWGVAAAIDTLKGGAGSWAVAGLTSSTLSDRRTTVNGYAKLGSVKLAGGVIQRDNDGSATTPRSDLVFFGATLPVGELFSLDAQVAQLKFKHSPNKASLAVLRGNYALSKRTALYAAVGHIDNEGSLAMSVSGGAPGSNPAPGVGQTGIVTGLRHSF
ncbi:porin [Aquabacterium sp.]|uniref:porin n=1 Tax=Aquabacterium sp. TaxID=1872578 RepID=UPI002C0A011E|nr:porin [Aquabacterium sp.]HSW03819.1 porin [Aquabacterium sp.]